MVHTHCAKMTDIIYTHSPPTVQVLPTQLPGITPVPSPSPSVEPTSQSVDLIPSMTRPSIIHGTTVEDLSRAVYACIAVAILLFIMAVVLSVIIGVLSYKQRKLCALEKMKIARKQSDEIWSASV